MEETKKQENAERDGDICRQYTEHKKQARLDKVQQNTRSNTENLGLLESVGEKKEKLGKGEWKIF